MKKSMVMFALSAAVMVSGAAYAGDFADATADTLWGVEIGGYIDVGYNYNFNNPDENRSQQGVNGLRAFDTDHSDFDVHAFQLYVDRLPEDAGEAGFRLDFVWGEDADEMTSGTNTMADFNLYQAYVSYIADIGNGLTLDLGRFATSHGYEALESPANDQFSRSIAFNLYQPFTHTGLRATYPINDQWEIMLALTDGWNNVDDDNDAKTVHGAIRWMPLETVYLQLSAAYGPEGAGNSDDDTLLVDLVANWAVTEQWTLGMNFDYLNIENSLPGIDDVDTWIIAGYVRYDVDEDLYLALRAEYGDTEDFSIGDDVWEITLTAGYDITDNLQARLEYRHDDADSDIFLDDDGIDSSQDTIAAEVIYSF